ncbi:hypothetical protein POMI540_2006 [Schizosaccharomyces pombe]|uniref:Uncharacterized protein C922.04 n=1 Tax=Schizosaccharomyces pombe (strain 972 / ATCC 24843) TaxID=284812 RepID=YLX4_SCHPO|nr:uncharacterized protein SPAC922.04 [Schizosaccharomyces pombe]Q9URX2.1 RecName: Full=Uncharacterized protein C922.04; Flags: Precursor [Schizosaccharomyces pombe 972h-]CAB63551.1 sequence orphan [Schizosaccharomyces pombe]|eukprot:NP_595004.1 uncharacterized protein SPAC922.04 [Schizosaccharomyces pombe]
MKFFWVSSLLGLLGLSTAIPLSTEADALLDRKTIYFGMKAYDDVNCKGSTSYTISFNKCQAYPNINSINALTDGAVCTVYVYSSNNCTGEPVFQTDSDGIECINVDAFETGSWKFKC